MFLMLAMYPLIDRKGKKREQTRFSQTAVTEIYCSISGNFHTVYMNKTGELSVRVTPACGGVEVGGVATLPADGLWTRGLSEGAQR